MAERKNKYVWLVYVAAFVFPFFGLAYGALERAKPEEEHRRRGKTCLILGIAATALVCAGGVTWLALGLKSGFGFLWPG